MKYLRASAVSVSVFAIALAGPTANAKDEIPGNITVAFGTGLNNSQPGNTPNHHIVPQEFEVRITKARKLDGTVVVVPATVTFNVAGFHWVWVYQNGVRLREVVANIPAAGLLVNYEVITNGVSNVFAKGVDPGTPPSFLDSAQFPLSATQNRVESFAFSTPGRYLVICNVAPHLIDGMYAWIRVVDDDDKHGHDHDDR